MEDYPRNRQELQGRFASESACREYLRGLRWPDGFLCPRCGCDEGAPVRSVLVRCRECRHQVSVTAGSIFQDTHIPLPLWFEAMWWVTQQDAASALGLQRSLGLSRYETAWTMLHRLRRAMVKPGCDLLTGRVEVDRRELCGPGDKLFGRSNLGRMILVVAAQVDGRGVSQVGMRRISDAAPRRLMCFVVDSIDKTSVVHTGVNLPNLPLEAAGFRRQIIRSSGRPKDAADMQARIDSVLSLLRERLVKARQGAISGKHLDYYLDEFTFHFNWRHTRERGKLFRVLAQQALATDPITHHQIVHRRRNASATA